MSNELSIQEQLKTINAKIQALCGDSGNTKCIFNIKNSDDFTFVAIAELPNDFLNASGSKGWTKTFGKTPVEAAEELRKTVESRVEYAIETLRKRVDAAGAVTGSGE